MLTVDRMKFQSAQGGSMILDLHTHMMISKTFKFEPKRVDRYVRMASFVGLQGMAVTEHLHASDYFGVYRYFGERFPYRNGVYRVRRDFAFFPGAEISIAKGGDILAIGPIEHIRTLAERISMPPVSGYKPDLEELLEARNGLEIVLIGAHMFRGLKNLEKFPERLLKRLDALEVNGKDYGLEFKLLQKASQLGLSVTGGSDSHHWLQLAVRATLVPGDRISLMSLFEALKDQKTTYYCGKYPALRVFMSQKIKRAVKWSRGTEESPKEVAEPLAC